MVTETETEVKMNEDDATGRKMLQQEKGEKRKNHKLEFVTSFLPETFLSLSLSESSSSLGRVLAATGVFFFSLFFFHFRMMGSKRLKHIHTRKKVK